ncbi:predicted protein [Naegleria gruberi]|uniref:Predicted protein n=1 Tax=Naegleria gruberi TaxID=5762 RepID=D2VHE6_NAEGR|nr:uncharacterized protein NAEGRDRAFT_79945 [Naegleria gruberi]EFC43787.1 predicted protein [Naegleria gruberi]|eukprot:XP_002676531.1 predicted protein [Naegleria gruberi strain NEG-M]
MSTIKSSSNNYCINVLMVMIMIIISTIITLADCQTSISIPFDTTITNVSPRISIPQNSEAYKVENWVAYGIYLGIVFLVILAIGVIFYFVAICFFCFRLCGLCGGCKPKKKGSSRPYRKKDMLIPAILTMIMYIVILVLGILGIIFSALFSVNVRTLVKETRSVISGVNGTINGVSSLGTSAESNIPILVNGFSSILTDAEQFATPINNMTNTVQSGINAMVFINSTTAPKIYADVENVRADLRILYNNSRLSGVPNPDTAIPNVQSQVEAGINTGVSYLEQGKTTIAGAKTTLDNTISTTRSTINSTVYDTVKGSVINTLNSVTSQISGINNMINQYAPSTTIDEAQTIIYSVENARISLVTIFFVWCAFLYIFALLGICCKKAILVEITSCCTCATAWLFFLVASLQIPIFILVNDLCKTAPGTVLYMSDDVGGPVLASTGFNITVNASVIIQRVANCSGDQNFITSALGNDYLTSLGLSSMLSSATGSIKGQLDSFNISSTVDSAKDLILQANITNIKTDYSADVFDAQTKLNTAIAQLSSIESYSGFSMKNVTNALDELNAYTTQYGYYYTLANITLLDPDSSPFNVTETSRNKTRDEKDQVLTLLQIYNETMTEVNAVNATLNSVKTGLSTLYNDFVLLSSEIAPVKALPTTLVDQLTSLANSVIAFVNGLKTSIDSLVISVLTSYINATLKDSLGCAYVGTYVSTINSTVCYGMTNQTFLTGLFSIMIGVAMIILFFILIILGKRIRYQARKGEDTGTDTVEMDMHH